MNTLEQIVQSKKLEIAGLDQEQILTDIEQKELPKIPSFKQAVQGKQKVSLIAEIKKASPSRGVLIEKFEPVKLAKEYAAAGASALSVLTESQYFQGSMTYLQQIAQAVSIPLLCKDFIIDPLQIYQARLNGASAVLLITAILDLRILREFIKLVRELGMDALVEIHNEKELGEVLHTSADILGINNRDLKDFSIDLGVTSRLLPLIPENKIVISESGIKTSQDIPKGVDAVLIGEGLIQNRALFSNNR